MHCANLLPDSLSERLKYNFAPYIVLPMLLLFLRMTYGLLYEKEKKIREGMKIMGMNDLSFFLSWIIYYAVLYTVTSLLVAMILCVSMFKKSAYTLVFFVHWLYGMTLIFQSIFVSVFFTKAKSGNIFAMVTPLASIFPWIG